MAVVEDIAKIIAAIQPRYAENAAEVRKALKKGIDKAVEKAKPKGIWEHKLVYDSPAEQLEPVYFWILDFMNDSGLEVEKLVDNFAASPGSGYFAELGARATKMQEEAMKVLGTVNTVIKSIINLIYDLKEFEIRLKFYDMAKSKDPEEREAGLLALKQIWIDKVDIQKGRGSINVLTHELMFATLRDAFMAAKSVEDVDKMDLNERVKRILKPRLAEFFQWKERSEAELRKRFEIEKSYLKSQVGALKLYSRWARPYLKAAEELMMKEKLKEPALVKAFNTLILELCLLGKEKINVDKEVDAGNLPRNFRNKKWKRNYYSCVLVDFSFRGIPSRTPAGHYLFGGKAEVSFKAFALNDDELKLLEKELEKKDIEESLKLVETITEESLSQITKDVEHFLGKEEKGEKEKKEESKPSFLKLFKTEKKETEIEKDSYAESLIREVAERKAADTCFKIYDTYKKAHKMPSFTAPEWEYPPRWKVKE